MQGVLRMTPRIIWIFFFSSRRRHTRLVSDWSSDGALPIWPSSWATSAGGPGGEVLGAGSARGPKDIAEVALYRALALAHTGDWAPAGEAFKVALALEPKKIGRASCREGGYSPGGEQSATGT